MNDNEGGGFKSTVIGFAIGWLITDMWMGYHARAKAGAAQGDTAARARLAWSRLCLLAVVGVIVYLGVIMGLAAAGGDGG